MPRVEQGWRGQDDLLVTPIRVSRATSTYNVHAYHTKVPVEAIRPYVRRNTSAGETVLDPFAGSGMTGVAALLEGRRAILNDLSPAAVHIARNYTTPCDPTALALAADRLYAWARPQIEPSYRVSCPGCAGSATTEYVVWSDLRSCPSCSNAVSVWTARSDASVGDLTCPNCGHRFAKIKASVVGETLVSANLRCDRDGRRYTVEARPEDVAAAKADVPQYWYPRVPFDSSWEMWRGGHRDLGIHEVADFWSARNLGALSVLWEGIGREGDPRLRDALRFVFTGCINRASRRYQWNAKRPTNVLGGTLYISSLRYEWNVLSLFNRKLRAALAFYREVRLEPGLAVVRQGSATDLSGIEAASIDYCFTDPPFGANIYYADASLLWEAWLGTLTPQDQEAVVSRKRPGKSVADYQETMARALAEVRRCLKPTALLTMVFQNTDQKVWTALRDAAADAGLHILAATTLHKSQPSFKGVKASMSGERVAATDVVMTLSPIPRATQGVTILANPDLVVRAALEREIATPDSGRTRSAAHLFAVAVSALVDAGLDAEEWSFDRVDGIRADIEAVVESEQLALGMGD
jgi:DNA modification methylase